MPVKKWVQENQRDENSKYHPTWKGWKQAETGRDNEIAIVTNALVVIEECLNNATAGNPTNLYLKNSTSGDNSIKFDNGVKRLKINVADYRKTTGLNLATLYVAFENVHAMASSPPTKQKQLNLSDNKKMTNVIIIHNPFTVAFTVGTTTKTLSDWGRYMTVLHELTHSLLQTKDVWLKGATYGVEPEDPDNAVSTDDECKALAAAELADQSVQYAPHLSWHNAENWTRAIMSCHPTRSAESMYV